MRRNWALDFHSMKDILMERKCHIIFFILKILKITLNNRIFKSKPQQFEQNN